MRLLSLNKFLHSDILLCILLSSIMESDKSQSATLRRYHGPVAGVKVLVVDANSACRTIVSKMLISLGYEGN